MMTKWNVIQFSRDAEPRAVEVDRAVCESLDGALFEAASRGAEGAKRLAHRFAPQLPPGGLFTIDAFSFVKIVRVEEG